MKEEIEDLLIDKYYKENYDKEKIQNTQSEKIQEFEDKLKLIESKMKISESNNLNYNIDFLTLIEKGESIREGKKRKKENLWFLIVGFVILMLVSTATVLLGLKFIIYFEVLIIIITLIATGILVKGSLKGEKS